MGLLIKRRGSSFFGGHESGQVLSPAASGRPEIVLTGAQIQCREIRRPDAAPFRGNAPGRGVYFSRKDMPHDGLADGKAFCALNTGYVPRVYYKEGKGALGRVTHRRPVLRVRPRVSGPL
jgi:hypothetical protein